MRTGLSLRAHAQQVLVLVLGVGAVRNGEKGLERPTAQSPQSALAEHRLRLPLEQCRQSGSSQTCERLAIVCMLRRVAYPSVGGQVETSVGISRLWWD
jgi:hypothetical protein